MRKGANIMARDGIETATREETILQPDGVEPSPPAFKVGGKTYSFDELRLSQDFQSLVGVKKEIVVVPVRRPNRQMFVYINPDPEWRMEALVLELKDESESYLVVPELREEVIDEAVAKYLIGYMTKTGKFFIWPIKMPDHTGRIDSWNESALSIVTEYGNRWVRIVSNRELSGYEAVLPENTFPPPTFPPEGFQSLVVKAFRNRVIDNFEHPVLLQLRGASL